MCAIGLDRHQAILHPFQKRLSHVLPLKIIMPMIWLISALLSIPHAYFNKVVEFNVYIDLIRCRTVFPEPQLKYKQWLTILSFLSQYVIPLSIATFCCLRIAFHIHRRPLIGQTTHQQIENNLRFR